MFFVRESLKFLLQLFECFLVCNKKSSEPTNLFLENHLNLVFALVFNEILQLNLFLSLS